MCGMIAIAAVQIATATATVETATATETFGATARGTRAGTAVHAATVRVRTTAPDNQNVARTHREPRRPGKSKRLAKSKHLGRIKRPDPTSRRAPINPATKASGLPTNAASAASGVDEAVADAAAVDAIAAKTTPTAQARA
jgi:hypothetical protein